MSDMTPIPADVATAFDRIPAAHREILMKVRRVIFEVAHGDPRIGPLEEVLRWGEPAYITVQKKTGTTIRLGIETASGRPAVFFTCTTGLVEEFRQHFGATLSYATNRAVLIGKGDEARAALKLCIAAALTYHLRKG